MSGYLPRRVALLLGGVLVLTFGIVLVKSADLGNSPLIALPYALSVIFPQLTFGNWCIVMYLAQVAGQKALMKKGLPLPMMAVELAVAIALGYVIDMWVWLLPDASGVSYAVRIALVLAGLLAMSFGVYLELVANIVYFPPDGFTKALSAASKKEYGVVKVCFDVAFVSMAIIAGLLACGTLVGVREGTVITAVLMGLVIRFYLRTLAPLTRRMIPSE